MKKIITINLIVFYLLLLLTPSALADVSQRIQVDEAISKKSIVITNPEDNEKYLLYLDNGCGELKTGQSVYLTVRGPLNGWYDSIKVNAYQSCDIEQVDWITDKLYVKFVYASNTEARVEDAQGNEYNVTYGQDCSAMRGYARKHIYTHQTENILKQGDKIVFPDRDGKCSIVNLKEIVEKEYEVPTASDFKGRLPTAVTNVEVIPRNGSVSLLWRPATDDTGISHYVISYNKYKINTDDTPFVDMPNQIKTDSIRYTIMGLENDETYYFYVIAVDTDGNLSSYWSNAVEGMPKSSIMPTASIADSLRTMRLRVDQESSNSFLIRWHTLPGQTRQSVFFEVDGVREFSRTDYDSLHMRILKKDHRKGKQLTLKVRAYGVKGVIQEEEVNFDF